MAIVLPKKSISSSLNTYYVIWIIEGKIAYFNKVQTRDLSHLFSFRILTNIDIFDNTCNIVMTKMQLLITKYYFAYFVGV